jgi:hypothetical protein
MPSVTARAKISASGPVSPSSLADDVLSGLKGLESFGFAGSSMHVFSWTLTALGRGPELEAALTGFTIPWTQAAIAFAAGDPFGAAEIWAEIGARTAEAYARLFGRECCSRRVAAPRVTSSSIARSSSIDPSAQPTTSVKASRSWPRLHSRRLPHVSPV